MAVGSIFKALLRLLNGFCTTGFTGLGGGGGGELFLKLAHLLNLFVGRGEREQNKEDEELRGWSHFERFKCYAAIC